jgi:hypothetical protein
MTTKANVFLPKTKFLVGIKPTERVELDRKLANLGKINEFYQWQQNRRGTVRAKEFVFVFGNCFPVF